MFTVKLDIIARSSQDLPTCTASDESFDDTGTISADNSDVPCRTNSPDFSGIEFL